jgi:hypothetical protein
MWHTLRMKRLRGECARACVREFILANVSQCQVTGCWLWLGKLDKRGYGVVPTGRAYPTHRSADPFDPRAHRASYRAFVGAIPKGNAIAHFCDFPQCVNPAHLSVCTGAENNRDMLSRMRHVTQAGAELGAAREAAYAAARGFW